MVISIGLKNTLEFLLENAPKLIVRFAKI